MSELRIKRCPVCRARMTGEEPLAAPCRRCGADLSLVRAAERRAQWAQAQALVALDQGDLLAARRWAHRALRLVDHPLTRATLAQVRAGIPLLGVSDAP